MRECVCEGKVGGALGEIIAAHLNSLFKSTCVSVRKRIRRNSNANACIYLEAMYKYTIGSVTKQCMELNNMLGELS